MEEKELEGRWSRKNGPKKPQIARDLIAGEESSVVVNLHDLVMQLVNILTELCVFLHRLIGVGNLLQQIDTQHGADIEMPYVAEIF